MERRIAGRGIGVTEEFRLEEVKAGRAINGQRNR